MPVIADKIRAEQWHFLLTHSDPGDVCARLGDGTRRTNAEHLADAPKWHPAEGEDSLWLSREKLIAQEGSAMSDSCTQGRVISPLF